MKVSKTSKLFVCNFAIALSLFGCSTSPRHSSTPAPTNETSIKTKFVSEGKLSDSEIKQVVTLANQCGIQDVREIESFHYLPTGGKGISVQSKERIDGRNISYDKLTVDRIDWGYREPTTNALHLGDFWADESKKYSILLREYEHNSKIVRIAIGENVDIALADKAIPLIFARKVHIETGPIDTWFIERFFRLFPDEPSGLYRKENGKYELRFIVYPGHERTLHFKLIGDEIFITGESSSFA